MSSSISAFKRLQRVMRTNEIIKKKKHERRLFELLCKCLQHAMMKRKKKKRIDDFCFRFKHRKNKCLRAQAHMPHAYTHIPHTHTVCVCARAHTSNILRTHTDTHSRTHTNTPSHTSHAQVHRHTDTQTHTAYRISRCAASSLPTVTTVTPVALTAATEAGSPAAIIGCGAPEIKRWLSVWKSEE